MATITEKDDAMGSCMSEWKDKHPHGRSKKKMGKKKAHTQAVAACISKTEGESFSFKDYLIEMSRGT